MTKAVPVVMKFGGTSLADKDAFVGAGGIVADARARGPVLVVASAIGDTTDGLVAAADAAGRGEPTAALVASLRARHVAAAPHGGEAIVREGVSGLEAGLEALARVGASHGTAAPRARDAVLAWGEWLSSRLLAQHCGAAWCDARDAIATDDAFGAARPDPATTRARIAATVVPLLVHRAVVVTQGFVGRAPAGATTTLGRGASSLSAAWFAAALGARELVVWTDVSGVFAADPRGAAVAPPIARLTFAEAERLARAGARMLHPGMFEPLGGSRVLVRVADPRSPERPGTLIVEA